MKTPLYIYRAGVARYVMDGKCGWRDEVNLWTAHNLLSEAAGTQVHAPDPSDRTARAQVSIWLSKQKV